MTSAPQRGESLNENSPARKETVYIVDGSSYIFRAFFAVHHLSTSDGFPTNALFGFSKMLQKLLSEPDARHVVVAFDVGRDTFRTELYSEYKANRDECPEDLKKQMPFFRDITEALGVHIAETPGFEADDVIATLTHRLRSEDCPIVIVTGDKDLMQLVDDQVTLWDTMRDVRYGPKEVQEKLGVPPELVVDFLGLTGDSSDNVPGVRGVGPKTAVQILERFQSIDKVLTSLSDLREEKGIRGRVKIADTIESDPEIVRLSRQLVTVRNDVPVEIRVEDRKVELSSLGEYELLQVLERGSPDVERLGALSRQFEFNSVFDLSQKSSGNLRLGEEEKFLTVYRQDLSSFVSSLVPASEKSQEPITIGLDLETTSLNPSEALIVGFALRGETSTSGYIPILHQDSDGELIARQCSLEEVVEALTPLLSNPKVVLVGQNLKYDLSVLFQHGIAVDTAVFDTMLAAYLLHPDKGGYGLDNLAREYLGTTLIPFKEVLGEYPDFRSVPIENATQYAGEDVEATWRLYESLRELLSQKTLEGVANEIEFPLVPVLARMELFGVKIDTDALHKMSKELEEQLAVLEKKIHEVTGHVFNVNSPKQLGEILFNELKIPTKGIKKTKTGFSTDSSVLEKLRDVHPVPELVLEYRMLHKLKSTYVDSLPTQVFEITQRIHARFNQTGTGTGRLSSSDPNLQNIPIRTPEGRRIRAAFIADEDKEIISADYSQIELRVLAHMSGDKNLTQAFHDGEDIHSKTAQELFGLSPEEVTEKERRLGKTLNFGIIYGMSGFRLARELGIPVAEGKRYIDLYFKHFSGVRDYFHKLEEDGRVQGYVTTLYGRRRNLDELERNSRDPDFLRRVAINAPIQGTAADLIKKAMVEVDRRIRLERCPLTLLMQIHDELVFECEKSFLDEGKALVREVMEEVEKLSVPLLVDLGSGLNWLEAH